MKEDFDGPAADGELFFEPAVSVTGAEPTASRRIVRPANRRNSKLRRKLGAGAVLASALIAMGGAYTLFAGTSGATDTGNDQASIAAGQQLYSVSCITCHGVNLEGIKDRGPSLLGTGSASVIFQVGSGRMPATGQGAEQNRKASLFTDAQTSQLAAYVQSQGGGPQLPATLTDNSNVAEGGELFRLNCASCHGATGKGAPLSAGKSAPSLNDADPTIIYSAMLTGPESMPIFSDNLLTPAQKRQIVSYVQTLQTTQDPGGHGIGRIGPVSDAIVIWVVGVGALMVAILWIGAKAE